MELKYGPYSPSRLETATCGYQFFHTYIEPRKEARSEGLAQARGSAVHEVCEKISEHLRDTPDNAISDASVRSWVAEAINRHPSAYIEVHEIIDMAKKYIRHPWQSLTKNSHIELKLAITFKRDSEGKIVMYKDMIGDMEVERPDFEECDYNDPKAVARGRADVLTISDDTTTAFILDHKTQPNVEEPDTFQLGFYAWVMSKMYPFLEELQTTLHFARYGKYSDSYAWTKEDLYRIEEQFLTRLQIIESRQAWTAVPYKNCQYCPFKLECPALTDMLDIDIESGTVKTKSNNLLILGDTNKAVRVAGIMHVIDEISLNASKEVRAHVERSGPIALPGKIFEFRSTEDIDWNKINKSERLREDIYATFRKYNVDPMYFMGFSATFTKNVWMLANEPLLKELAELFPRRLSTKFSGYKV